MKMFIILGTLAISIPAIASENKNYQYKDLSSEETRLDGAYDNKDSEIQEEEVGWNEEKERFENLEDETEDDKTQNAEESE